MLDTPWPNTAALHLYDLAATDERQRLERYKRAWNAYHGSLPDTLKVKPGQPNDNVQASKCRVIVDSSVAYLFGQNIEFEVSAEEDTPEEEWLDAVWDANRKMTLLSKLAVNGAVCGHTFLKIVPNHPTTAPYPRLIVLDPATVSCTWDDDDIEMVREYRIQWNAIDPQTRKPVVKRQVVTRQDNGLWLIRDFQSLPQHYTRWVLVGEEMWRYAWAPVLDCQNIPVPNEFWGEADIPNDIINLTQSRNFALSNWARIVKYQAHQRLWGKGFRDNQVKLGVDDIFIIESDAGQLASIEPTSNMAGLSDLDRRLDEAIHEGSRTPAIATGKVEGVGQLSGVALQILYGPLVQKTEAKRQTYGDMLRALNRHLLELGGYTAADVSITWPEILPQDMQAERAALQVDTTLGVVSKATVAQKLGYDWETEQARMEAEAQADQTDNAPTTGQDATAPQILGYHIEQGIVTRNEARAALGLPPDNSEDNAPGDVPAKKDADSLVAVFDAIQKGVDAGIDLESILEVIKNTLGLFTDAQIRAITQAQEDSAPDPLEAQMRMEALNGNGQPQPGQPGPAAPPQAAGPGADSGGIGQGGGNGQRGGGRA